MEMKLKIHDKIKMLRKMNDLTQEEMAEKLHLSLNGYTDIERGKVKTISHEKIEQILRIFNIDYLEFLSIGELGKICFIGENNHIINVRDNNSFIGTLNNQEIMFELSKMKLQLENKEEIIEHLKQKIQYLEETIEILKNT